jgi:hypothetical protein
MPTTFYPEYPYTIDFLNKECQDLNWTMNCPALIKDGPVRDATPTPPRG